MKQLVRFFKTPPNQKKLEASWFKKVPKSNAFWYRLVSMVGFYIEAILLVGVSGLILFGAYRFLFTIFQLNSDELKLLALWSIINYCACFLIGLLYVKAPLPVSEQALKRKRNLLPEPKLFPDFYIKRKSDEVTYRLSILKKMFWSGLVLVSIFSLLLVSDWANIQQVFVLTAGGVFAYLVLISLTLLIALICRFSGLMRFIVAILFIPLFFSSLGMFLHIREIMANKVFVDSIPDYWFLNTNGFLSQTTLEWGIHILILLSGWLCWKYFFINDLKIPWAHKKEIVEERNEVVTQNAARQKLLEKEPNDSFLSFDLLKVLLVGAGSLALAWACIECIKLRLFDDSLVWLMLFSWICVSVTLFACLYIQYGGLQRRLDKYCSSQSGSIQKIGLFPSCPRSFIRRLVLDQLLRTVLVCPLVGLSFTSLYWIVAMTRYELFVFGVLLSWLAGLSMLLSEVWSSYVYCFRSSINAPITLLRIVLVAGVHLMFWYIAFLPVIQFISAATFERYTLLIDIDLLKKIGVFLVTSVIAVIILWRLHIRKVLTLVGRIA